MVRRYQPRSGSLQFVPRKRAKRLNVRFKSWPKVEEAKPLGFAAYKVGMTHVMGIDDRPNSPSKGREIMVPVTIVEAPAMKVYGVRLYEQDEMGLKVHKDVLAPKIDPVLKEKIRLPKKKTASLDKIKLDGVVDVRLLMHTQPNSIQIEQKVPHLFEIGLGGTDVAKKIEYAKEVLGKEITVNDVFSEDEYIDVKAVTKGKGMQGVIKRYGVARQRHKSSIIRVVGALGTWNPGAIAWTVPRPGQMGFHTRTEYNKKILKISNAQEEDITPKGGFLHYGTLKSTYLMLAGSIAGVPKRVVGLRKAIRTPSAEKVKLSNITYISTESKQGV